LGNAIVPPSTVDATKKRAAKLIAKGLPIDFTALRCAEPDGGTTNIRKVKQALDALASAEIGASFRSRPLASSKKRRGENWFTTGPSRLATARSI
jgi:hypothetical protein